MAASNTSISNGSDASSTNAERQDSKNGGTAVQSSARASSASLRTLRKEMTALLAQSNIQLAPQLSSTLAFTRNQLRNAYLRLLFHAPFTKQAHHAEQGMWADTTHKVVVVYRSRLSKLAKLIKGDLDKSQSSSNTPSESATTTKGKGGNAPGTPTSSSSGKRKTHAQEYSRLAEAFRAFLAKEEAFWKALAKRLATVFQLVETQVALDKAGITGSGPRIPVGPRASTASSSSDETQPVGLARLPSSQAELDQTVLDAIAQPRHRDRLLEIVFKILVFSGDLARYREIYKDSSSSSHGAARTTPAKNSRQSSPATPNQRRSATSAARDFSNAIMCYEAARLLLPSEGNPSNQLAVIATYQNDIFGATYHNYRALCVKRPFETSKINLGTGLSKAVDAWEKEGGIEYQVDAPASGTSSGVDLRPKCYRDFVVLQGLFFTRRDFMSLQPLATRFLNTFEMCVTGKILPTDSIVRIVITSLAASWSARLWRRSANSTPNDGRLQSSEMPTVNSDVTLSIEVQLLHHVIGTARVLLSICTAQTQQALQDSSAQRSGVSAHGRQPRYSASDGLAKNITAVTRRVLPALRVISKWTKAHLDYMDRHEGASIVRAADGFKSSAEDTTNDSEKRLSAIRIDADLALVQGLDDFWTSYVDCINTLHFAFPFDALPTLSTAGPSGATNLSLEEDLDLRGFIPTRKGMLTQDDTEAFRSKSRNGPSDRQEQDKLNPNEEQLMRIADLLIDAKIVAESDNSPIVFDDERNVFKLDPAAKARLNGGRLQAVMARERSRSSNLAAAGDLGGVEVDNEMVESQWAANDTRGAGTTRPHNGLSHDTAPIVSLQRRPSESSLSIGTSEATEDVVDLAMRAVADRPDVSLLDDLSDEEEDEILLPSVVQRRQRMRPSGATVGATASQDVTTAASPFSMQHIRHTLPQRSQAGPVDQAPIGTPLQSQAQTTLTAQDLLLHMLNGRPSTSRNPTPMGSPSPVASQIASLGGSQSSLHHRDTSTPTRQQSAEAQAAVFSPHSAQQHQHQLAQLASIWGSTPPGFQSSAHPGLLQRMVGSTSAVGSGASPDPARTSIWNHIQHTPVGIDASCTDQSASPHQQQPFGTAASPQPNPSQYHDESGRMMQHAVPDVWGRSQQHHR